MNKKISLGAAISLMALAAAVAITLTAFFVMNSLNVNISDFSQRSAMFKKLSDVDSLVRSQYVGKIDETELTDSTISGYVQGLNDKYGFYLDSEDYNNIKLSNEGKSIGIGINIVKNTDGFIKIVSITPGSPASTVGLKVNDLITTIGGSDVKAVGYANAVNLLKGNEGTSISITVLRDKQQLNFTVVRKKFDVVTVSSKMIGNLGYVKISEFGSKTAGEFSTQVDALIKNGAEGLIFDVRNNPGGQLEAVQTMIDKIVPAGPIVRSTDKSGKMKTLYTSDSSQINLPMAVLANENSASAAELFTAALKDYKKADSVGTTTYGKGTMQEILSLSDGTALDLSVAYFYPPTSDNFEGKGVTPDIPVELSEEKLKNFYSLSEDDDDQLQAAISAVELKIE